MNVIKYNKCHVVSVLENKIQTNEKGLNMDINEYISCRLDDQINWYDSKAIVNQKKYKKAQTTEIILAATIPFLSAYAKDSVLIAIIVGICGVIITILQSLTKLNKWHENWIEYRTTCELLRYQKHLYITKSSPYNDNPETTDNLFIRNIENIISSENNKWKIINEPDKTPN